MDIGEIKMSELEGDHLAHYGVLGMKWGIRRYQNADGTRTEAGKAHESRERKKTKADYDSGSNNWKMKDARHLTDDELNRRNSRLQRERQYRDLTEPPIRKETRQALKKIFIGTLVGAGTAYMAVKYKGAITAGAEWLSTNGAKAFLRTAARGAQAAWLV